VIAPPRLLSRAVMEFVTGAVLPFSAQQTELNRPLLATTAPSSFAPLNARVCHESHDGRARQGPAGVDHAGPGPSGTGAGRRVARELLADNKDIIGCRIAARPPLTRYIQTVDRPSGSLVGPDHCPASLRLTKYSLGADIGLS